MKKLFALLLTLAMVLSLAACGGKEEAPAAKEETKTEAPAATEETGSVYYLNFKPEFDEALQGLAKTYTEKTGVEVKVVTAASGTYSDTLTAEMAKDEAPTVFNIGNMSGLKDWDEYAIDLSGTALAGELKAMGHCFESFGIIVNVDLLKTAGYELSDITNFETLKAVADDIHARAGELGFDAFSAAGLAGSSSWRFSGH